MRDVAALAGVSLKTVSRVINGAPTVDPALTDQVRRAAAVLNYKPNLTASSLRRRDGRSMMIGLMLEDIANPYSSTIYWAAEVVARGLGVGLLAGSIEEDPASTGPPGTSPPTPSCATTGPEPRKASGT